MNIGNLTNTLINKKTLSILLFSTSLLLTSCTEKTLDDQFSGDGGNGDGDDNTPTLTAEEQNGLGGSGRALETALADKLLLFQANYTDNSEHKGTGSTNQAGTFHPEYMMNFIDPNDNNKLKFMISEWSNSRTVIFNSPPTSNSATPDVVIGQPDFTTGGSNSSGSVTASGLSNHTTATVCSTGQLVIADYTNNRVLIYNTVPTTNGVAADVVVGQPDFTSSNANQGGAVAANTLKNPVSVSCNNNKLYVSDAGNNRVLVYDAIPTANNTSANLVFGQSDFTSTSNSCTSNNLSFPRTVSFHQGKMYVVDQGHHRILIYNSIPTTSNPTPNFALGQADLNNCSGNQGGAASASTLNSPHTMAFSLDGGFAVSDRTNHRVLLYRIPFTASGTAATAVIGQSDFTSTSANQGGSTTENSLSSPIGLAFQGSHLWINDQGNHRTKAVALPSY